MPNVSHVISIRDILSGIRTGTRDDIAELRSAEVLAVARELWDHLSEGATEDVLEERVAVVTAEHPLAADPQLYAALPLGIPISRIGPQPRSADRQRWFFHDEVRSAVMDIARGALE